MKLSEYYDHISNLMEKDQLKEALDTLRNLLKDSPKLDEAILQSARFSDIMKQIRLGTISFEDANISKNQIRLGILNLLEEVKEKAMADSSILAEVEQNTNSDRNITIQNSRNIILDSDIKAGGDIIIGGTKSTEK